MLKLINTLTLFLFGILAQGQITETRTITEFSKMEVRNVKVVYTESDKCSLKIESDYNDSEETVYTEVVNGTLKITGKSAGANTIVYITGKDASDFKANKAEITISNFITTPQVAITLNSGAKFTGNISSANSATINAGKGSYFKGSVYTNKLSGKFSSDAKAIICGTAKTALIESASTAICNARNFVSDSLAINATGNSSVSIYATNLISINVLDSARVVYNGVPVKVQLNENAVAFQKCKSDRIVTYNY